MSNDGKSILGRPITGDVEKRYYKPIEQWPADRLLADLDAVFNAAPDIFAIQWKQYTPYFNDGDPCEFSADLNYDAVAVRSNTLPTYWSWDEVSDENGEDVESISISDVRTAEFNEETRQYDYTIAEFPGATELVQLFENFAHYEHVVREHFGEHSVVIATRDGFNVEYYEHD